LLFLTTISLVVALSHFAWAVQSVDWAKATPDGIFINEPTTVTVTAQVGVDPNLIPSSVSLIRYDSTGKPIANLGTLFDDGTHGDTLAGDNIFSSQVIFNEPALTTIYLKVSAAYRGTLKRTLSNFVAIPVLENPLNIDHDGDGFTENQGDCDDTNPDVNPGAEESCFDNGDNNCDGLIDFEDNNCQYSIDDILLPPEPDPCEQLNLSCESALFGNYLIVSTMYDFGISTVVSDESGAFLSLDWIPEGNGVTLFVSLNGNTPLGPSYYENIPSLSRANVVAAVMVGFGTAQPVPGNLAGCDGNPLGGDIRPLSCGNYGACCDQHDSCIDENCTGKDGNVIVCDGKEYGYLYCEGLDPSNPDWVAHCEKDFPRCSPECRKCHEDVRKCINAPSGPGRSKCCERGDCGKPQQCIFLGEVLTNPCECKKHGLNSRDSQADCPDNGGPGDDAGDVHLVTFDHLAYDFQGVGEFVSVRSIDDNFEIQTRKRPWRTSRVVSVNSAVAMNVAGDRIGIYNDRDPALYINGVPTLIANDLMLPNGGIIRISPWVYIIEWPDGIQVQVYQKCSYLNLKILLPETMRGLVEGLLGNFNGNRADDLTTRDGIILSHSPSFSQLYQQYGESWRITQEESLFDYLEGTTTETYTDKTFPGSSVTTAVLSDSQREQAEQICRDAGVTDPVILEACILDVGLTGDRCFSEYPGSIIPPQSFVQPEGPVSAGPVTWEVANGGNGHLYEAILVPGGISWDDANAAAQTRDDGWHLATITSPEENAIVFDLVGENSNFWNCCIGNNSEGPWLGGLKVGPSVGDYTWVNNEAFSYTNWGPLEPFGNGDRIGFFGYQAPLGSFWNDVPESRLEFGYIIEKSEGLLGHNMKNPAKSCLEILRSGAADGDRKYWIEVPSGVFEMYCDFNSDTGGWTRVGALDTSTAYCGNGALVDMRFDPDTSMGKLPDSDVQALITRTLGSPMELMYFSRSDGRYVWHALERVTDFDTSSKHTSSLFYCSNWHCDNGTLDASACGSEGEGCPVTAHGIAGFTKKIYVDSNFARHIRGMHVNGNMCGLPNYERTSTWIYVR